MKKQLYLSALLCTSLVLSSCGLGTTGQTSSGLVGANNTTTSVLSSTGSTVVGTLLSTLLGNTTSQNSIVGTWTYSAPKIAFESQNILAQIGSSVASSKLESTLDSQLKKIGFSAGKTSITFANDGTCKMLIGSRTYAGTYMYNSSTGVMTINGALGLATVSPYVSVMGTEMYMLLNSPLSVV